MHEVYYTLSFGYYSLLELCFNARVVPASLGSGGLHSTFRVIRAVHLEL